MFITSRSQLNPIYFSEILLLTKTSNISDLADWLHWHINILHFNHVTIYDNESFVDIKPLCDSYSQVSYNRISGWPNQYKLYNDYINNKCQSQWCIPIDDDEFIYIGEKYNYNVNTFIQKITEKCNKCRKISLAWKNMFSKSAIDNREGKSLLEVCDCISHKASDVWKNNDGWVKTFVNTRYEWEYAWNRKGRKINSGHNPSESIPSYLEDGRILQNGQVPDFEKDNKNAWIGHFQYKSRSEWEWKCKNKVSAANKEFDKNRVELYDKLYEIGGMKEEKSIQNLWEERGRKEEKLEEIKIIEEDEEIINNNQRKIIVSMTSWPKRINNVETVIKSILNNTITPDSIELNLSFEEFPNGLKDLPDGLLTYNKNGILKINFVNKNTNVFKKFIPTLKKYYGLEYYLLTIDDDYIYFNNYIEKMIHEIGENDCYCLSNKMHIIGNRTIYNSRIFKNDFWEKITDTLIYYAISDKYIFQYIMKNNGKFSEKYENFLNYMNSFNPIFPNSKNKDGASGIYDCERIYKAYKEIENILQCKIQ